jgi:hypothetical protein
MSTELRMRWKKQNKLFEIFYCFVYKMMIFSGFWHPRSQGLTADTALPEALAKTKTGTSKIL